MTVVVKIENLWKEYRLGVFGHGMLFRDIQSWWARARGHEDPNTPVGQVSNNNGRSDRIWALRDLSVEVEEGEVLGIIGRNGAGKSTLLKILSRVTAPTKGSVRIRGRVASLLEVGTGFHPELTGRENTFLNGAILGMTRAEIRRKFDEIVDFAGIKQFIDTPVKRYSSGMYVRLAFAVAAHLEPEILLVDEVLAVGDAEFQQKCLGKLGSVVAGGATVLFVSHNMGAVRDLCARSILFGGGTKVMEGDTQEVISRYVSMSVSSGPSTSSDSSELVSIQNVQLLDFSGAPAVDFSAGSPVTVCITYLAHERVERPNFWLTVYGRFGAIFSCGMLFDGHQPEFISGEGVISCKFATDVLLPQTYSLRLGVGDQRGMHKLSKCNESYYFNLVGNMKDLGYDGTAADSVVGVAASVAVPYEWHLPDGTRVSVPRKTGALRA